MRLPTKTAFVALASGIVIGAIFFSAFVSAWTGPTATAPGNNVAAPLNVGSVNQTKNGNLGVNGLAVFGNTLLATSTYLNFGAISGSSGYGIWDNGGVLNFKNSGGSWQTIQQTVAALVGSGTVGGSGSTNYVPRFTAATTLGNSSLSSDGSSATSNGNFFVNGYTYIQSVNGEGGTIQLAGNNGVNMWLENINGSFRILNSPWNAQLFSVDQSGNMTTAGSIHTQSGGFQFPNGTTQTVKPYTVSCAGQGCIPSCSSGGTLGGALISIAVPSCGQVCTQGSSGGGCTQYAQECNSSTNVSMGICS